MNEIKKNARVGKEKKKISLPQGITRGLDCLEKLSSFTHDLSPRKRSLILNGKAEAVDTVPSSLVLLTELCAALPFQSSPSRYPFGQEENVTTRMDLLSIQTSRCLDVKKKLDLISACYYYQVNTEKASKEESRIRKRSGSWCRPMEIPPSSQFYQ